MHPLFPPTVSPAIISKQIDNYLWDLSMNQNLIDDIENALQVVCLFHPEKQILYLIDDYYHIPVAIKHITHNPRNDLMELAYLWFALIQIARGKHATVFA